MNEVLLRTYVRYILKEQSRPGAGDKAQKRIAAWLIESGFEASVNKSGSQSADVIGIKIDPKTGAAGARGVIESKNSEGGSHIYSQELTQGSPIADVITFSPGSVSGALSLHRFRPAINKNPIKDMELAQQQREAENALVAQALTTNSKEWQVVAGGSGPTGPDSQGIATTAYAPLVSFDGTLIQKDNRPIIVVVRPNVLLKYAKDENEKKIKKRDKDNRPIKTEEGKYIYETEWVEVEPASSPSRVFFTSDGSSKMRPAMGGSGEETLGTFMDPGEKAFTDAWRQYYAGHDDYFAIVTGGSMYIGYINTNPLGLNVGQLSARMSMGEGGSTMTYGGANVTGLREKVMVEILGGSEIGLPSDSQVEKYISAGELEIRGKMK